MGFPGDYGSSRCVAITQAFTKVRFSKSLMAISPAYSLRIIWAFSEMIGTGRGMMPAVFEMIRRKKSEPRTIFGPYIS